MRYLGATLVVRSGGRSVTVRVIDCNCQATNSLDLYADAFRVIAPLSSGRITITISGS